MNQDKNTRKILVNMLLKENAHISFDNAVKGIPYKLLGIQPASLPYSIWQLAEHIRITQWDILEFSRNPKHISPSWPVDYWPKSNKPLNVNEWKSTLKKIKENRKEIAGLISDSTIDLFEPFAHGDGQNLFREAILIIDHTAYHTGQILVVRRLLNNWD
jgi:hypothetical protein